jgi:hypothetical protein
MSLTQEWPGIGSGDKRHERRTGPSRRDGRPSGDLPSPKADQRALKPSPFGTAFSTHTVLPELCFTGR